MTALALIWGLNVQLAKWKINTGGNIMGVKILETEIISDEEIERVHANANFGGMDKRTVVNQGVLKCASGYYQGSTSNSIILKHGLITDDYKLTDKGRAYLWAAFSNPPNESV